MGYRRTDDALNIWRIMARRLFAWNPLNILIFCGRQLLLKMPRLKLMVPVILPI